MNEAFKEISLITIGCSAVGKSSLSRRFANDFFEESYMTTIGIDSYCRDLQIYNKQYSIKIWDSAGQERFETITAQYLKKADGILLIFDVTQINSFDKLQHWVEIIKEKGDEGIPLILIGNKIDLEKRNVTEEEAKAFAKELNVEYFEVSAKSGKGVNEAFIKLIQKVPDVRIKKKETAQIIDFPKKKKRFC